MDDIMNDLVNKNKRNIPFRAGMMFESKTHPQFNCMITFVMFRYDDENNYKLEDIPQIIDWSHTNKEEFDKFCYTHCRSKESTFPYAWSGECNVKSFKSRLKKYNLEFVGMSEHETIIYSKNDNWEFSEGIRK